VSSALVNSSRPAGGGFGRYTGSKSGRVAIALSLTVLTLIVLVWRRPDHFLHPYFWIEELTDIVLAYGQRGLISFFDPIGSYYVLTTKVIMFAALMVGFDWAPAIALWLSVIFNAAVVVAVALSPTYLRWRLLCAVAVLIVPCGPEVYASPISSFFWAGILLILAVLWDSSAGQQKLRIAYILIGGLSSPLIVPIAGLLAARAFVERTRPEKIAAICAIVLAAIQTTALAAVSVRNAAFWQTDIIAATSMFWGHLVLGPRYGNYLWSGLLLVGLLGLAAWTSRSKLGLHFLLLAAILFIVTLLPIARWDIRFLSPIEYGARYFFHPYVVLAWIMIWLAAVAPGAVRVMCLASLATGVGLGHRGMSQRTDTVVWSEQIDACRAAEGPYRMPIHFNGKAKDLWHGNFSSEMCRQMTARSLFARDRR